jgi:hypothetical protein
MHTLALAAGPLLAMLAALACQWVGYDEAKSIVAFVAVLCVVWWVF